MKRLKILLSLFIFCFFFLSCSDSSQEKEIHDRNNTKDSVVLSKNLPIADTTLKETQRKQQNDTSCPCKIKGFFSDYTRKIILFKNFADVNGETLYPKENTGNIFAEVDSFQNGRFLLKKIGYYDAEIKKYRNYWIDRNLLSSATGDTPYFLNLYKFPSDTATVLGYLKNGEFRILSCKDNWVLVNGLDKSGKEKVRGWVLMDIICGNPYTNCGNEVAKKYVYKHYLN